MNKTSMVMLCAVSGLAGLGGLVYAYSVQWNVAPSTLVASGVCVALSIVGLVTNVLLPAGE